MRIVIVGAGFTGIQLAKLLINEKNQVTVIDNDEDIIRHVSNQLDCTVMCADGNNLDTLEPNAPPNRDTSLKSTSWTIRRLPTASATRKPKTRPPPLPP